MYLRIHAKYVTDEIYTVELLGNKMFNKCWSYLFSIQGAACCDA